jgi:DNA-binding CsgD family transcriptional regulator
VSILKYFIPTRTTCAEDKMESGSLRSRFGYLPVILVTILEVVGEDAMLRIVRDYGGVEVSPSISQFSSAIGEEVAQRLVDRFKADHLTRVYIPLMVHSGLLQRDREIAQWRADGVSVSEIARRHGMSQRGIYYRIAHIREQAANDLPAASKATAS